MSAEQTRDALAGALESAGAYSAAELVRLDARGTTLAIRLDVAVEERSLRAVVSAWGDHRDDDVARALAVRERGCEQCAVRALRDCGPCAQHAGARS